MIDLLGQRDASAALRRQRDFHRALQAQFERLSFRSVLSHRERSPRSETAKRTVIVLLSFPGLQPAPPPAPKTRRRKLHDPVHHRLPIGESQIPSVNSGSTGDQRIMCVMIPAKKLIRHIRSARGSSGSAL